MTVCVRDWPVGAAGFEPLHLRIEFAKTLSPGREKSNMRISSKVVVPPPCQRKSQAMTNTSGSDSEMHRTALKMARYAGVSLIRTLSPCAETGGGSEARARCRRLAKDWECLNRKALAFLHLASIRLMLRKLCNPT